MPAALNIAVLGLGRMGQRYAQLLAAHHVGARLYAAADPRLPAEPALLDGLEVPVTTPDPRDVLGRAEVDAVVIATPTDTHAALVIAAAEAGKAIFCEKPLALTRADSLAALDAVARAGVPLQVGLMRRFDAAYRQAKAAIDAGAIGTPVTFKAVGRDPFCPDPAFADPARSGGLLLDMGIHDFDLARWLMGSDVARITAEGSLCVCRDLEAVGDFDNAVVNLRFASGALGNVEVSRNAFYGYDIRTEVLGSEGALQIGDYRHTPLVHLSRDGARRDVVPYLAERFGDAYQAQLDHFIDCLHRDRPPAVTGADALAAFEMAHAATEAARTGRPVALGTGPAQPVRNPSV